MADSPGRPRVLVAADHYVPGFRAGGPIRSLANLIELLGEEISFTVVTRDRDVGAAAPYLASSHLAQVRGTANVVYAPPGRRAIALLSTAKRNPFDVLYLNSLFSRTFGMLPLMARCARLLPKSRLLIAPRGELHPGALALNRGRKVAYLRLAALLQLFDGAEWHASTDEEAAQIRRWIDDAAPIHVAPNLFVIPRGQELDTWPEKTSGALRLAFLSRVHPTKNLDFALGVLQTLSGNIALDIYGPIEDERYWTKCRNLMSSLPDGIRAAYRGTVGRSEVLGVLAQHDVLFLPTRGENFGHVIVEALAAGCPPLISDQTPWDVASRRAGWSLGLDEPERFAETLTRLLEMEDREFRGFRTRARRYAEEISASSVARRANRELFISPPHTRDAREVDERTSSDRRLATESREGCASLSGTAQPRLDTHRPEDTRRYWAGKACGAANTTARANSAEFFRQADSFRFAVEPVAAFARFDEAAGRRVLEIGTGMGGDVSRFLAAGAEVVGIDLSPTAVASTTRRLKLAGLPQRVVRADALALPFPDDAFDLVWSWGVLHHTGAINTAVAEVQRVLRPGAEARLMLYHRPSWVALAAWGRWGLLGGRPFQGLKQVVADHVESPGTLALTVPELHRLFTAFDRVQVRVVGTYWDGKFVPGLGRVAGSRLGWFALIRGWKPQPGPTTG